MLARLEAGAPPLPPLRPAPMTGGCVLAGAPGAGELFPQPGWLDDVLEPLAPGSAWLLSRAGQPPAPGILALGLDDTRLETSRRDLTAWLDAHNADAVLVRPDRYVFGTGKSTDLLQAWTQALTPLPSPHAGEGVCAADG
jgi:3-(3-hydroxy-phenyl)propionate hydroxylase